MGIRNLIIILFVYIPFKSFSQTCISNIVQADTTVCPGTPLHLNITLSTNNNNCNTYNLSAALQNGLTGWYPFCNNTNDIGPQQNSGFPTGPLTYSPDRYNNPNRAIKFTGNGESVRTNKIERNTNNSFSYIAWVNTSNIVVLPSETINPNSGIGVDLSTSCVIHATHGYNWNLNSQHTGAGLYISQNGVFVLEHTNSVMATPLVWSGTLDGWHAVAIVYDNHVPKLYVDGQFIKDGLVTPYTVHPSSGCDSFFVNSQYPYITCGFGKGFNPSIAGVPVVNFKGSIDDIKIYNRALTPAEIIELYNKDQYRILWSTGDTTTGVTVTPSNTTKYWVSVTDGNVSCSDTITVNTKSIITRDTSICEGSTLQLKAASALIYQWSPATGLNNPNIQNPILTAGAANSSTTYSLSISNYSNNLVVNGDFEQGNTGFFTNYINCTTSNCLMPLGDNGYSVGTNASFFHGLFAGVDHTSGSGNFMIINGARPTFVVWRQTIPVSPNTDYAFGTWVSTLINVNTASIRFSINGVQLGRIFAAPARPNQWVRYFTTWNSGANTQATIEIVNVFPQASGNDFGLDDIFFGKIISCTDSVKVTVGSPSSTLGDTTVATCIGNFINLTSLYSTTGLTSSWTTGGSTVGNPAVVTIAGSYQVIATNPSSCKDTALVTVGFNPLPSIGSDKSIGICPGTSTDLTSQFNTAGLTTNWTIGGVSVTNPSAVTAAGNYRLIVSNSFGCADTAFVNVNFTDKPSLGIDQSVNICAGFSTDLTTQFVTTGLTSSWTVGGVVVSNVAAISVAGVYQLIVTNGSGCKDTALVTVGINPSPGTGSDKSVAVCPGFSADLTTQYTTTGLTATWTIGGAAVSNPSAVTAAGNYRLVVSNSFGCADTAFVAVNITAKPNLGIDKSVNICPGFSADLTTQFITTGLTSNWSFGGAAIVSPTAITSAGIYQLIAISAPGCIDTALVTVSISPKPTLGIDKAATACSGNSINLNNQFTTTGLTTVWAIGGVVVTNPAAITISGIYQLIATTASGCSDTALCTFTIFAKPFLGRDTSINICPGSSLNLTAQYPVTGVTSSWTRGGIAVPNPAAINQPGVYQLIGANVNNCSDTALLTLTVDPNPTVVITNPANLCEPQTANLTLPSVTVGSSLNLTFSYFRDTTALSVFATPAAAPSGTYYIKGTNATGCFDIKKVGVFVYPIPVVKAGADTTICKNTTAVLHVAVTNILAPVFYQWEPAASIENPTAVISIANPGTTTVYKVTVKDTYGCNFNVADEVKVTVQPPVNAFAGNDTTATVRVPHQLRATGGVQYLWSPASALNNPFISNPLAVLNMDTRFAVEVKDTIGCVGYDTVLVKVYEGITYYVPNAFSPNGDGLNDVFKPIPVGIVSTNYFRIFNRYGAIVFETNQWNKGWDGTYKEIPQKTGNYVWVIKGAGRDGKVIEMRGNVVLVR